MRIGITGGHSELLYDMILLFQSIGLDVFVIGGEPDHKRPSIDDKSIFICNEEHQFIEQRIIEYQHRYGYNLFNYLTGYKNQPTLNSFLESTGCKDAIETIAEHVDIFYGFNTKYISTFYKSKPIYWQLIGGENITWWNAIKEVLNANGNVICYSENQASQFSNRLNTIHFYKDPDEWSCYNGNDEQVMYVANALHDRKLACHEDYFFNTRIHNKWCLAGSHNEFYNHQDYDDYELAIELDYDEYQGCMQHSRLFYNLGTEPAPYTLAFIEALMTGMPILTGDYKHPSPYPKYQVPELLGDNCILTDNKDFIKLLLDDKKRCKMIGDKNRDIAIREFGLETIKKQWSQIFNN